MGCIHYIFQNGLGEKSYGFRLVFQENEVFLKDSHHFQNEKHVFESAGKGRRVSITETKMPGNSGFFGPNAGIV